MMNLPENKRKWIAGLLILLAFLVPFLLLCGIRILCTQNGGGEPGADCFYHAKMALEGPGVFCVKKFPLLAASVWKSCFADKELAYHFLLRGLFRIQSLVSGKDLFPFTFPAMVFTAWVLLSFLAVLKRLKIPPSTSFLSCMLLAFVSFGFTYRLLLLRPHVLSIAFLLFFWVVLSLPSRWRIAGTFLLSLCYTWSYSNPQFILIPACIYAFFAFREGSRKSLWIPAAALFGILAGYTLHPQFPNTFLIWKLQSVDALFGPLFRNGKLSARLAPMEMMPGNFAWYRHMLPFYILMYFSLLLFCRLRERKETVFNTLEKSILLAAAVFTIGTFAVLRSVEYAVPFGVLAFAILLQKASEAKLPILQHPRRLCGLLFAAAAAFLLLTANLMLSSSYRTKPPYGPAQWLKTHTEKGSMVINLDWGDFPAMFYANTHNRLFWGMDPMFSYAYSPKLARGMENLVLRSIQVRGADLQMHDLTGADYAFILSRRKKFIEYLKARGWVPVYESEEGCIFSLK